MSVSLYMRVTPNNEIYVSYVYVAYVYVAYVYVAYVYVVHVINVVTAPYNIKPKSLPTS